MCSSLHATFALYKAQSSVAHFAKNPPPPCCLSKGKKGTAYIAAVFDYGVREASYYLSKIYLYAVSFFSDMQQKLLHNLHCYFPKSIEFLYPKTLLNGKREWFWPPHFIDSWLGSLYYHLATWGKRASSKQFATKEKPFYITLAKKVVSRLEQSPLLKNISRKKQYTLYLPKANVVSDYSMPGKHIVIFDGYITQLLRYYETHKNQVISADLMKKTVHFSPGSLSTEDLLAAAIAKDLLSASYRKSTLEHIGYLLFSIGSVFCQCIDQILYTFQSAAKNYSPTLTLFLSYLIDAVDTLESSLQIFFTYTSSTQKEWEVESAAPFLLYQAGYNPCAMLLTSSFEEEKTSRLVKTLYNYAPWLFTKTCPEKRKAYTCISIQSFLQEKQQMRFFKETDTKK